MSSAAAISGIGVVSPLGVGREPFWRALVSGRAGIGELRRFDPGPRPPRLGAEVPEFAARELLPPALVRRMDRLSQMIGVAAVLAARDAGLGAEASGDDLGVVVGSALGNLAESAQFLERVFVKGPALANPMLFPNLVLNAPASQIAMALGWRGPNLTVSAGEVSGEAALRVAVDLVTRRRARAVVVAAGEELSAIAFRGLKDLGYLGPRRGRSECSCPFDVAADGPVAGEGAAALLIEAPERARERGAARYATIDRIESTTLAAESPHVWPRPPSAALPDAKAGDVVFSGADSSPERDVLELSLAAAGGPRRPIYSLAGALGTHPSQGLLTIASAALTLSSGVVPPLLGLGRPRAEYPFYFPQEPLRGAWSSALAIGAARGGAAIGVRLEAVAAGGVA